jgi:hypothetical protein
MTHGLRSVKIFKGFRGVLLPMSSESSSQAGQEQDGRTVWGRWAVGQ